MCQGGSQCLHLQAQGSFLLDNLMLTVEGRMLIVGGRMLTVVPTAPPSSAAV